ncbi:MAG: diguanylate cyclase [Candidatus Aureabacteria bacterium]|nr:diguanylate cyclase [Candidatus Auribacterota bacterium]
MKMGQRILIIEKDVRSREKLYHVCRAISPETHKASSWAKAQAHLKKHYHDMIIIGLTTPHLLNIETIRLIRHFGLDSCILVSGPFKDVNRIVECLCAGAYDVILKPINEEWAKITVTRAIERRRFYDEAQKKEHYWRLSIFDELTRIHNHRYFHYSLTQTLSSAQRYRFPLSILMMDLDNFKSFNDRYGHLTGDEVLRVLGAFLSRSIRAGDIVARYGGEEFALILPHTHKRGARAMAEKIRREVEALEFNPKGLGPPAHLTASIGVASFPRDARSKDDLLRKADSALYKAKHRNKNTVCCV